MLQGIVSVIVVQCYGTDLANEIKTQPSVASLTNSLRLLDFRLGFLVLFSLFINSSIRMFIFY